jgi:ABC-2 type transport system ATP-binding protein
MIETTSLSKRYGSTLAVDDVSLHIDEGSVFGLVGSNGAGKTTLLGLLAGLKRPSSGSVRIDADHQQIAVLSDTPRFDEWLTGREVVALAQHLVSDGEDRVEQVLSDAGLDHAADRAVGGYSRGMLQRLGLACAVVGNPSVLLLDEPASALDPQGRREVLDLVSRLRGTATVMFSSHILADVQQVCDTVGILDQGRLRFQGSIENLLVGSAVPRYVVRLRPPLEPVIEALTSCDWIADVEATGAGEVTVTVGTLDDAETQLVRALADANARVVSMGPEAVSLERAFLEVTT